MFQRLCPLLLAAAIVVAPAHAAVPQLEPGKWQVIMSNETTGEKPTSFTMTQCMDKDQLMSQYAATGATDGKADFEQAGDEGGCKFKSSQKDNVVSMETQCGDEVTKTTGTYVTGTFLIDSLTTSKGSTSKVKMEGKRLGGC